MDERMRNIRSQQLQCKGAQKCKTPVLRCLISKFPRDKVHCGGAEAVFHLRVHSVWTKCLCFAVDGAD